MICFVICLLFKYKHMIVTIASKNLSQNYVQTNISSILFSSSTNISFYNGNNGYAFNKSNYNSSLGPGFGPINNSTNDGDNIDNGVISIIMLVILSIALFGFLISIIYIIKEECKHCKQKKEMNNMNNMNYLENQNKNNLENTDKNKDLTYNV